MKKPTELTPIKSSMLTGHHYDPDGRVLTVEFQGGKRYAYSDVPAEKFEAFKGNASPGGYFAANIRNNHAATKL